MSALDDPGLMRSLVGGMRSSHSGQGRAVDTALSHQKRLGGENLPPSAMSMRRRERQAQLQSQREINEAWGASVLARSSPAASAAGGATVNTTAGGASGRSPSPPTSVKGPNSSRGAAAKTTTTSAAPASAASLTGTAPTTADKMAVFFVSGTAPSLPAFAAALQVPTLPTVTPSFTKAADEGVEVLGGTRMQAPGYTTMVGLVPTADTVQCIDDDYELISSMRPYRYDDRRAARQHALRRVSAPPHPDLLRQLEPTLAAVCPTDLVDVDSLPLEYLLNAMRAGCGNDEDDGEEGDGSEEGYDHVNENDDGDGDVNDKDTGGPRDGTYPFVCQGRPTLGGRRRLPGNRQAQLGQYNPRYGVVDPRVTGGYMKPVGTAAPLTRAALNAAAAGDGGSNATGGAGGGEHGGEGSWSSAGSVASNDGRVRSTTMRGTVPSRSGLFGQTNHSRASRLGGTLAQPKQPEAGEEDSNAPHLKPGENIKGSSMFLSKTERKMTRGTAAPNVMYWPYPDARSTVKRILCTVQYNVPQTYRRRDPPVSGVPSAVYEVCNDIANMPQKRVVMATTTGRDAHWYGKKWGTERATQKERQHNIANSADGADPDAALRATRPKERCATLPPRTTDTLLDSTRRRQEEQLRANTVSVEMNLAYPPSLIGGADKLTRIRTFDHTTARSTRGLHNAAVSHDAPLRPLSGPYDDGSRTIETALALTRRQAPSVHIHGGAPGHGPVHTTTTHTELGETPNLRLVKPTTERATTFGPGASYTAAGGSVGGGGGGGDRNPAPAARDLSYDCTRGFAVVEPRVRGDPAIGSVTSRQQRDGVFATHGCGPSHVLSYDGLEMPDKVKSVQRFETQITKETQFVGHRIQSERWNRKNPKAPGPGFYNVSYKAVD